MQIVYVIHTHIHTFIQIHIYTYKLRYTYIYLYIYIYIYIQYMNACTVYIRPVRSIHFLILHIKYNTYLYFNIICINNFYKKIVTFGHEAFKV